MGAALQSKIRAGTVFSLGDEFGERLTWSWSFLPRRGRDGPVVHRFVFPSAVASGRERLWRWSSGKNPYGPFFGMRRVGPSLAKRRGENGPGFTKPLRNGPGFLGQGTFGRCKVWTGSTGSWWLNCRWQWNGGFCLGRTCRCCPCGPNKWRPRAW